MKLPLRCVSVLGVAVLALATAACGSQDATGSAGSDGGKTGDYKILMITANSGPFQIYGEQTKNAMTVEANYINAAGGINGRKIVLDVVDDQGDPTKAVSLLQSKLSGGQKPDAVYAGTTSNEALALLPILTRNKIFNIGVTGDGAINDPEKFPYTFRANSPYAAYTPLVASAVKARGYQKVGVLYANDALGGSSSAAVNKALGAAGVKVVNATFDATSLDLSAPMSRLKSAGVDAVVFGAVAPATAAQVLEARAKAGATDIPFIADQATTANLAKLVPAADLKNVFSHNVNACLSQPSTPQSAQLTKFIADLKKLGPINGSLIASVFSADILKAVQVAAKQAGSTDAAELQHALETMPQQPAGTWVSFGDVAFSAESHFNTAAVAGDYSISTFGPIVDGQVTPQK
ncbi:ABC transporter substrate-binding protein [Streptomyces sp. NPDC059766]|uniref:ABC transporter substrate-binding protein n=1 Tax=Streptomyces sp. NPDC059766 TaxID=3346940 RepID=UPI00364772A0